MRRGFSQQAAIATLGVIICLALLLTARTAGVEQPAAGGSFIEGITAQAGASGAVNLDPLYATASDLDISSLIFSGLTRFDSGIKPDLAFGWNISNDGLTYTFNLRRGVRWHDGQPFTAADVLFTISLLQNPRAAANPSLVAAWQNVQATAPDTATVILKLPQPYAPFLSFTTVGILPAHLLGQYQADPTALPSAPFNLQPIGTGPYRLPQAGNLPTPTPAPPLDSLFTLERNPDYFGRPPYIARFAFRFYPNPRALLAAFNAGEIDGISYVAPENVAALSQRADVRLYRSELARTTFIFLNNRLPIFAPPNVRLALSLAINRKAVVDDALYGQAAPADSPLLPSALGYQRVEGGGYDYNPDKATLLLDQADWRLVQGVRTNQQGVKLQFTLLYNSDNPYLAKVAQLIATDLGHIGVIVTVEPATLAELVSQHLQPRNFDAALLGWQGLDYDPDPYSLWHSTQADNPDGFNFAGWVNDQADLTLEQGRQRNDPAARAAAYRAFQTVFASEMPSLPIYYPYYTYATNARVQGVTLPPLAQPAHRFQTLARWFVLTQFKPPLGTQ